MRRLFLFALVFGINALLIAADHLPFETLRSLALTRARLRWGEVAMGPILPCYDLNREVASYIFTFRIGDSYFPTQEEIEAMIREGEALEAQSRGDLDLYLRALRLKFGTDQFGNIVLGARYDRNPIYAIGNSLPPHIYNLSRAYERARAYLGSPQVELVRVYYLTPLNEFFEFSDGVKSVYLHSYSLQSVDIDNYRGVGESKVSLKGKWDALLSNIDYPERFDGYVPNVPSVPLWSYGCSPTASSMIFWFWDWFINPNGYGRFVDHFFDRWDNVERHWDFNLPNVHKELASAMGTDSMSSGGTQVSNIAPGHRTVFTQNGYNCTSNSYYCGNSQTVMTYLRPEIDAGRPVHWCVLNYYYNGQYINHSVCAVGYKFVPGDTLITVHNTWQVGEFDWTIWTPNCYEYVITVVPGTGSSTANIKVTEPTGRSLFKNMKYRMKWITNGTGIDHVKIWWAPNRWWGNDSTYWTVLTSNAPNNGVYIFTAPNLDTVIRLNIAALSATNQRLAAHGSYIGNQLIGVQASSNFSMLGHYDTDGTGEDVRVSGANVAFMADGLNGVVALNVADSTLPDYISKTTGPCDARKSFIVGNRLYVADALCSLKIYDISNPNNIVLLGKWGTSDGVVSLYVRDSLAYLAANMAGLRIVRISNPANPVEVGYLSPNQTYYDITVVGNYAYVAAGRWGLRVIDISNPASPREVGSYDSPGIAKGICVSGNWAYLADGSAGGLRVVDISNPASPQPRGMYDSPGEALKCELNGATVFLADGSGGVRAVNVTNPDSPVEIGYLDPPGNVNGLYVPRISLIYLAAGDNGLIIASFRLGIEEGYVQPIYTNRLNGIKPNPVSDRVAILFETEGSDLVNLRLYDVEGRLVKSLVRGRLKAGIHTYRMDVRDLTAGVYFLRFEAGSYQQQTKMVVAK